MKKAALFLFMALVITGIRAQSVKTEYIYLSLINRQQNKQLIKDNLRNAEIIADSLFRKLNLTGKRNDDSLAVLFFKELAVSYYLSEKYPEAMFTFLRQRFLYPDAKQDRFAVYYFTQAAAFENISKGMTNFQIKQSAPEKVSSLPLKEREYTLLNNAILLNVKEINPLLLHYADMIKELQNDIPEFVDRWTFLVHIGVRQNLMRGYVNYYQGDTDTLSFKLSKIFNRKAARYYLKNKAWNRATVYIRRYDELPLKLNNKITSGWFKLRKNLHF